ncbi:MAG: hypothetical protein ACE5JQ_15080, partial [Candidatus Methylomirabilales bacterium]
MSLKDKWKAPNEWKPYLDGTRLFGEDLDDEGLKAWFEDEKFGYAELEGERRLHGEELLCHQGNARYGFR